MALQGLQAQLEQAGNLCLVLACPSDSLAAVLAGTSVPRVALQLAVHLECAGNPEATVRVGEAAGPVGALQQT